MGVYLTNLQRWTNHRIPFECNDGWALKRIEEFNRAVGKTLFITRKFNQASYVKIEAGAAQSNIGMKGGVQTCNFGVNDLYSIFHELGHCVGLGHEYFHNRCPFIGRITGLHRDIYSQAVVKYTSYAAYDGLSIMNYNPAYLGIGGIAYVQPRKLSNGDIQLIKYLYPNALPF
jgi:hypothetical protein